MLAAKRASGASIDCAEESAMSAKEYPAIADDVNRICLMRCAEVSL